MATAATVGRAKHTGPHPDDPALPAPDEIVLLLSRTSYGIRTDELEAARSSGYEAWLERQLAYEAIDDAAFEAQLATALPTLAMSNGELIALAQSSGRQFQAVEELRAATLLRRLYSPRQLYETVVEFWTDHFNIHHLDGPARWFKTVDDREVIRRHALGRFGDLLRASARSPAMLFYLDNYSSVAGAPNENYARELMELHTLGIDGGYTEQDVLEVARAFTGWTLTGVRPGAADVTFQFVLTRHDAAAKTVLGTALPAGRGIEDGEDVLDLLIAHPSTARHLAAKLCRRFIADDPQETVVDAVAAEYARTGGDIRAMLRVLFLSPEFRSSWDRKLKRPVEYLFSALRAAAPATTGGAWLRAVGGELATLGHLPFDWPTPDGYPDAKDDWIATSALLQRWNFAFALAEGQVPGVYVDVAALAGSARTPTQLVDRLADILLRRPLAAADRDRFVGLAAGRAASHRPLPADVLLQRTRELVPVLLASAYFQYR